MEKKMEKIVETNENSIQQLIDRQAADQIANRNSIQQLINRQTADQTANRNSIDQLTRAVRSGRAPQTPGGIIYYMKKKFGFLPQQ